MADGLSRVDLRSSEPFFATPRMMLTRSATCKASAVDPLAGPQGQQAIGSVLGGCAARLRWPLPVTRRQIRNPAVLVPERERQGVGEVPERLRWDAHEFLPESRISGVWAKAKEKLPDMAAGASWEILRPLVRKLAKQAVFGGL